MTTQNIQISGRPESEELQKVKAKLAQAEQEITAYDMTMNRQSKLIAELEAQLEAVGAGGVSPLMGASQSQPVVAVPVAFCQPDDPRNESAFSWPGTARNPIHETPLYAAPQPPAQLVGAEFAIAALVAAGHVTQAKVDQAIALAPQPPAQALDARIFIDDAWKVRLLDGRNLVRDEMGCCDHPALPIFDEGIKPVQFFDAFGIELAGVMAEDQMDGDAYDAMIEASDYNTWTPAKPKGDGWTLVSIFDTEDGPAAWWVREKPAAIAAQQGGAA